MTASPLSAHIASIIEREGPVTLARYMELALNHPEWGYYRRNDPLGAAGDFITAPEISQMFGEIIGAWLANAWLVLDSPAPVLLAELGPGRGTLLRDALHATAKVSGFHSAIFLHLAEINPALRMMQQEALKDYAGSITWHDAIATIPDNLPILLIANEFFDALPVHSFVKTRGSWRETLVALDKERGLVYKTAETITPECAHIPRHLAGAEEGSVVEHCPAAVSIMSDIARRIVSNSGAALIVDYGYNDWPMRETLQSVRRHQYHPPLENPGEADLTAHVNFSLLAETARRAGAAVFSGVTQGNFLTRLGIELRARALLQRASSGQRDDILSGMRRLIAPEAMGTMFKCLAVLPPSSPAPPGFA